ncbi:MAG: GAP family protein [Thermomicrobiales bacterium]
MATPLLDSLLLGIGIALNPAAVIAIILVLTQTHRARPGVAFLAGWVSGLLLLVILPSLIIMEALRRLLSTTAWFPAWLWLSLGLTLLAAAVLALRDRATELDPSQQPRWAGVIAAGGLGRIFGLGATLSLASLRNIVLLAAAVAIISSAGLGAPGVLIAAAIFLGAASLGVLAPLLVFAFGGRRAAALLEEGGTWLQRNLFWLKVVVLVLLGAGMVLHGLGRV